MFSANKSGQLYLDFVAVLFINFYCHKGDLVGEVISWSMPQVEREVADCKLQTTTFTVTFTKCGDKLVLESRYAPF